MKKLAITGWRQKINVPTSAIIRDSRFETPDKGRVEVSSISNRHAFTGILIVATDGRISEQLSSLFDTNGSAHIHDGNLNEKTGEITFSKTYGSRNNRTNYRALREPDGSWHGTFSGPRIGFGHIKFILQKLPETLFIPVVAMIPPVKVDENKKPRRKK